jgi:hypothetical protein
MQLLTSEAIDCRRLELQNSSELRNLADRLKRLIAPLLEGPMYFPEQKALLSRDGGVCVADGSRLGFDPLEPQRHRCPRCGRVHEGERHHRAWVWRYHIWLSERAIHLSLLGLLNDQPELLERARYIVDLYSERYADFPNSDNVLGPTRLFFSTYLESIWLIQLIIAASLLRTRPTARTSSWAPFNRIVRQSADLIASFDEGWSNRQVWNDTAMIAAGLWLGGLPESPGQLDRPDRRARHPMLVQGLDGTHGIRAQLVQAVSEEGMWCEGENYHFFALRGFLLAAELLRTLGIDLYGPEDSADRLRDMYTAPLLTTLPDLSLPARGDSPFAVSLLQPRFAELWEIGWARTGDDRLESILAHLYSCDAAESSDPGLAEMAEQEQNRPPQRLSRELLGWKALCWMSPRRPSAPEEMWQRDSVLLPGSGLAVLRTARNRYVSVECGRRQAGHGHPDLLHVTLHWDWPLLVDMGTGSYVSPSLHWYRSALAHNAPGISGIGQVERNGWCAAFDHVGEWAWCRVVAEDLLGNETEAVRTVVIGPSSVLDVVEVLVGEENPIELPIHTMGRVPLVLAQVASDLGLGVRSDDVLGSVIDIGAPKVAREVGNRLGVLLLSRMGEQLYMVERRGPPDIQFADGPPCAFVIRRARGSGVWVQCYNVGTDSPTRVSNREAEIVLEYADASHELVEIAPERCRIVDRHGGRHELGGVQPKPVTTARARTTGPVIECPRVPKLPDVAAWESQLPPAAILVLGAENHRRSELEYGSAGEFRAKVAVFVSGTDVCYAADVVKRHLCVRRPEDPDPELDNEVADIHSDGLQCYLGVDSWSGFLLLPDLDSPIMRGAVVAGTAGELSNLEAEWTRTDEGYRALVRVNIGRELQPGARFPVNLVVNEMYPGRTRRAGQLALAGGGGWVYLRGDREDPVLAAVAEVV